MAYQVTGNEYLSLPTIRENDGAVEGVTFLYMQAKGLLEIRGKDGLIRPYVELDGQRLPLCPLWSREHCWIPRFVSEERALRFTCTYLTPVGERALVLRLSVQNQNAEPRTVRFGTDGQWDQTLHEVNETTELTEGREAYGSGWNHMFIFSQKPGLPLFAFAPCVADPQQFAEIDQQSRWNRSDFAYDIYRETVLQPGEPAVLDIPWGVGYEGVAASTSAKELLRQDRAQEAVELLDLGLERMPTWQIRFTDTNTYPFLEAYYAASAMGVEEAAAKGDALLREYAQTLIEYIEYYLRFEGTQGDMVSPILDEKLDQLGDIYYLATYAGRKDVVAELNTYYRSLGVSEDNLVDVGDKPRQADTTLIPKGTNE